MQRGVSMVELLAVMGIMVASVALGLPVAQHFALRQDLPAATRDLTHILRRAQLRALLSEGGENVGVRLTAGTGTPYVLFRGASYASRNADVDEAYTFPTQIGLTFDFPGSPETVDIIFSRVRGKPNMAGTVYMSSLAPDLKAVRVNAEGRISIELP